MKNKLTSFWHCAWLQTGFLFLLFLKYNIRTDINSTGNIGSIMTTIEVIFRLRFQQHLLCFSEKGKNECVLKEIRHYFSDIVLLLPCSQCLSRNGTGTILKALEKEMIIISFSVVFSRFSQHLN